jgi:hypothetical protein
VTDAAVIDDLRTLAAAHPPAPRRRTRYGYDGPVVCVLFRKALMSIADDLTAAEAARSGDAMSS